MKSVWVTWFLVLHIYLAHDCCIFLLVPLTVSINRVRHLLLHYQRLILVFWAKCFQLIGFVPPPDAPPAIPTSFTTNFTDVRFRDQHSGNSNYNVLPYARVVYQFKWVSRTDPFPFMIYSLHQWECWLASELCKRTKVLASFNHSRRDGMIGCIKPHY